MRRNRSSNPISAIRGHAASKASSQQASVRAYEAP